MRVRLTFAYDLDALATLRDPGTLVLMPELVDGGYAALRAGKNVHTMTDATLRAVRSFSRRMPTTWIAGSWALKQDRGTLTNTVLVFHRGACVSRYDKIHLFRPADEPRFFTPGTTLSTFTLRVDRTRLRAGVIICYDLRFPELTRYLAREGSELLLVPARWPAVRDEAWRSLLKARAIENQLVVAGCNARGEEGGHSYVFDPTGALLLDSRQDPGRQTHGVDLDLAAIREQRARLNSLDDAVLLKQLALPRRFTLTRGAR